MSDWKCAQASYSKPAVENIKFVWTIENFKRLGLKRNECTESSPFASSDYKWALKLYPKGKDNFPFFNQYSSDVNVILVLKDAPQAQGYNAIKTITSFYLLSDKDEVIDSYGRDLERDVSTRIGDTCQFGIFLNKELDNGRLIVGALRVGVEITIIKDIHARMISNHILPDDTITKIQCDMSDYSEFYNNKALSDVEIINAKRESFNGHKLILSKNSTVFATAFQHQMKENQSNQIIIDKIRPDVLANMLNFIYTAKLIQATKDDSELIQELLSAADLYDIKQLKELCETLLLQNISTNNVLFLFVRGDMYRCAKLKKAALHFIILNRNTLFHSTEWIEFLSKYPQLANEIVIELAK